MRTASHKICFALSHHTRFYFPADVVVFICISDYMITFCVLF